MAILRSDLPGIDTAANSTAGNIDKLRHLIMGHQQKLAENVQQSGLDTEKYAANKDVDVAAKQQEQGNAIDAVKQMTNSGMVNEGGSVTVNGVGYGKGYDPSRMMNLNNREGQQLIKGTQPLKDSADSLETLSNIADLMDSPNAYDQKQLAVLQARLAEGKGQRLLQSVIDSFGAKGQTVPSAFLSGWNKLSGGAAATLTPEEKNAIREHTSKQASYYGDQMDQAEKQLRGQLPALAPNMLMNRPDSVDSVIGAPISRGRTYMDKLSKRQAAALQQGGPAVPPAQENHSTGIVDKLASFLGGGGSQAAPAQASAPAQAPSGLSPAEQQRLQELRARRNAAK